MLRHIILITFRSFWRNKSTLLIHLIGFSTGLASVLLIYLWVNDEMSMDTFHEQDGQLYQVMQNFHFPDGISTQGKTPVLLGEALQEVFPEVEASTFIWDDGLPTGKLSYDNKQVDINRLASNSHFFEIFSYPLILGNKKEVLVDKNSILLSRQTAEKLFSTIEEALGKKVELSNQYFQQEYFVSGIFADPPSNSIRQFDVVFPYGVFVEQDPNALSWLQSRVETFLILNKSTKIEDFNKKIASFLSSKNKINEPLELFVQQYSKKHLYNHFENGKQAGGRINNVRLFSFIALFILLIASINFVNLSTAQASKRMKEIGVKKTLGARKKLLIYRFLFECISLALMSIGLALIWVFLFLPQFNLISEKNLELEFSVEFFLKLLALALLTGLFAGSYPAFYLSRFKPIDILKGGKNKAIREIWLRKGLVVVQFTLSLVFILGFLVIDQQLQFTQSREVGFSRDNVISFQRPRNFMDVEVFLEEIKRLPGVEQASNLRGDILSGRITQGGFSWRGQSDDQKWLFHSPQIGYNVIETLGMKILEGRSYSRDMGDDGTKVVINASARDLMQLEEPIGFVLGYGDEQEKEIIGVVEDFQYGSFHQEVRPLIFDFKDFGRDYLVRILPGSELNTLREIEKLYKKFHPDYAFNFSFLDDANQKLYDDEIRVSSLSKYFAFLAILISCLGLFGLSTFTTEQRKKEIGIRKVLGANVINIVRLLSADFSKTVALSILIAIPIGYYLSREWLNNFAYHIELHISLFLIPAGLILLLAWATVAIQTFRAASLKPVHNLRDE
ncbi:MAG: FtsX-like permease family protein [Bacteroidota bacterium]